MFKLIVLVALVAVVSAKPGLITTPTIYSAAAPIYSQAYAPIYKTYSPLSYSYSHQYSAPAYYKAAVNTPYIYGGLPLAYQYHGAYLH